MKEHKGDQHEITTRDEYVTAFYLNFQAYIHEEYFSPFQNMKQQDPMTYYSKEFHQASLHIENISPPSLVVMYIAAHKC